MPPLEKKALPLASCTSRLWRRYRFAAGSPPSANLGRRRWQPPSRPRVCRGDIPAGGGGVLATAQGSAVVGRGLEVRATGWRRAAWCASVHPQWQRRPILGLRPRSRRLSPWICGRGYELVAFPLAAPERHGGLLVRSNKDAVLVFFSRQDGLWLDACRH
jgi:hypothetical protein